MIRHLCSRGLARLGLLALGVLLLGTTPALAENLIFTNKTGVTVVIQGACIDARGVVRRDKPILLRQGDVAKIALPGPKIISLWDPNAPNKLLGQAAFPAGNVDLAFLIQFDPKQLKFGMEPDKNFGKK